MSVTAAGLLLSMMTLSRAVQSHCLINICFILSVISINLYLFTSAIGATAPTVSPAKYIDHTANVERCIPSHIDKIRQFYFLGFPYLPVQSHEIRSSEYTLSSFFQLSHLFLKALLLWECYATILLCNRSKLQRAVILAYAMEQDQLAIKLYI